MAKVEQIDFLAGVAFCYGKGKRAITSPIIFSPFGEVSNFCFSSKESRKNKMIIFNSGLLGGYRNTNGSLYSRGSYAHIWSSLESDWNAWKRQLQLASATVLRHVEDKDAGFSVRCLKD